MFDDYIDKTKDELIDNLCELIKVPSISDETNDPSAPFGTNCNNVLDKFLSLASSMGFKTKNIDNYCGYVEFGEGTELVGLIGHLDVVPADINDGWTTPPFMPSIRDCKLFGRGSVDDKGPVMATLYAMYAIKNTVSVNKRVRLIVGLNEEKSWKCIDYYKMHEEHPTIGFSPDANFPAIYAEKGILSVCISNDFKIKNYEIINIDCNNNAINVVPKYASITLKGNNTFENSDSISITSISEDTFKIEAFGIASHAAHPELGKNAVEILVNYLLDNFEFETDYLDYLYNNKLFEITSPSILRNNDQEIIEDESGELTSNVASLEYNDNRLFININLRVPVTISLDSILEKYKKISYTFPTTKVKQISIQEPLYVEKNSYLVKTLVNIFNKKTGLNAEPIAIGGGTYARAFNNCISYGVTMPGDVDMCHQVDEYVELDKLILSSKIYAEAIYELAK